EEFLAPYRQAQAALPNNLVHLGSLIQDNPAQVARKRRLEALSARELAELDALRASAAGPDRAAARPHEGLLLSGEASMGAARAELAGMQAEEERLLGERTAHAARVRVWGIAAVAGSAAVGLLGGLLATLLFTAGVARRVGQLEANAGRLAGRLRLLPPPAGRDELGRLGQGLEAAGALLGDWERELGEARAFLEYLIATGPGLIYRADLRALRPTYVSPNVERLLGYTPAEVLADPQFWTERVHPDDREPARVELMRLMADGASQVEVQQRLLHRDGRYRWFSSIVSLERDGAGEAIGLLACGRDVTERREAEEALRRANEELERRVAERTADLSGSIARCS